MVRARGSTERGSQEPKEGLAQARALGMVRLMNRSAGQKRDCLLQSKCGDDLTIVGQVGSKESQAAGPDVQSERVMGAEPPSLLRSSQVKDQCQERDRLC